MACSLQTVNRPGVDVMSAAARCRRWAPVLAAAPGSRPQAAGQEAVPPTEQPPASTRPAACSRRGVFIGALVAAAATALPPPPPALAAAATAAARSSEEAKQALQAAASASFANRDFQRSIQALDELVALEPEELRWREMRAQARALLLAVPRHRAATKPALLQMPGLNHCFLQALVDAKEFYRALDDFDVCLKKLPAAGAELDRARLLSGAPACCAWPGPAGSVPLQQQCRPLRTCMHAAALQLSRCMPLLVFLQGGAWRWRACPTGLRH